MPSMSRHGLVTTPRTKSRLRRWFASTRPINCGIAARCDAAHKKSPLEPRVRAGSGSTQATDKAALSYRALTRGGGRRGGLTRRGTPNSVKEITPFRPKFQGRNWGIPIAGNYLCQIQFPVSGYILINRSAFACSASASVTWKNVVCLGSPATTQLLRQRVPR